MPGHVGTQSDTELAENIHGVTLDDVVRNLTEMPAEVETAVDPAPRDIVFSGDIDEINRLFIENEWSDGLPIVPPTPERVESFLAFTDRAGPGRSARRVAAGQPRRDRLVGCD